jgi:hypothetical protein
MCTLSSEEYLEDHSLGSYVKRIIDIQLGVELWLGSAEEREVLVPRRLVLSWR